jgi:hypothetical protein
MRDERMIANKPTTEYMVWVNQKQQHGLTWYQMVIENHEIPKWYVGGRMMGDVIAGAIQDNDLQGLYDTKSYIWNYLEIGDTSTVYYLKGEQS